MLAIRGLTVSYGAIEAVRGIDLDVNPGEVVALLGPNGAGKTSTLRAATALASYGGSITYEGDEVSAVGTEALARRGLVHVPEGRRVFPTLTVHENLQVGTTARAGRTGGHSVDDVYDLFPPLVPLRDRSGWALSGGEQQMVAIGRALVAAPRMLLLDEPSLGLAPIIVKAVFSAMAEIARTTPILVVEQNTVMALRVCSRAAALVDGRIAMQGTAAEMSDRSALLDSYLGTERVHDAEEQLIHEQG
jgi:branched-chain amino acid transport system ATP-binding protein